MNEKKFTLWHRIAALFAFVVSAITYLLTIEPSAPFWDCGEFIASSYKLEVGHPPGNPAFQLFARFFTMFGDNMHAAILVNAMSGICSALTIMFLYLLIVWFVRRMVKTDTLGGAIAVIGSGLVGALVYCFSDTFWFSAVEGEVYAMSSLFTAAVFWASTMWYDRAEEPHSSRLIVLIAFLMGISIGVHLLNLLAIPAIVFIIYYRKRENGKFTFWEFVKFLFIGIAILGFLVFLFVPYLPKIAAYVDLFFVNVLGLPYNSGAAFFLIALLGLCFWGLFATLKRNKVFLNTALLCFTMVTIGFSIFTIDVIRSCAKTPTNEYQPDNAFTLVRYLNREQYGSTPLIYGQYYDAPYELKESTYWAPLDGKYKKCEGPVDAKYKAVGKMLFPRMWSPSNDGRNEKFYQAYTRGKGKKIAGKDRKPSMGANLYYFFDYQLGWMYWRYFMWNFVGRQNEIHSPSPGNIFHGNWESGIGFIDKIRLGDQSGAPRVLKENKGKNHYFFLPLLLGLLGLFFQFDRDKRGCWLNFRMFFMTGIAIVVYLNQPPFQVRERDYAYAGSFYFFSAWAGMAVAALYTWINDAIKKRGGAPLAAGLTVLCLCVPVLMACQNWDDHDRSNRRTAVEMACNYLNSVGPDGILITHGDNDTFPVWYAQEVEDVRTDVRICNTSLLGTDWHIDQMKWACNESAPLALSVGPRQYLYGTNEYVPIVDTRGQEMNIADVMMLFRHPDVKLPMTSGRKVDYIASRRIVVPVNKENVIKYGILDAKYADMIPESITLRISDDKEYLTKPELFMLDLLSCYEWDRPISVLNMGGDLNMGIKEYLTFDGYSFKFIPIKNKITNSDIGFVDTDELWRKMTEVYTWDAQSRDDYFIDYQNIYTNMGVVSTRQIFQNAAKACAKVGENDRAEALLDHCQEIMHRFPLDGIPIGMSSSDYTVISMIDLYYKIGARDKGRKLAAEMGASLLESAQFYIDFYEFAQDEFENCGSYIYFLADILTDNDDQALADKITDGLSMIIDIATGGAVSEKS
ncbi:MAG: DUF2723 domain-containing protein [Bacteroidales bacterium]|nr:DUF2723 domain-containing protein [Bacteroidales bacterium]